MSWSPNQYLRFADHRARPGLELLARVPDVDPAAVFDLGSGTGNLTKVMSERWPGARVVGIDSSKEMIEASSSRYPDIPFGNEPIETWTPDEPVDVIFSNATLHWLDHHGRLLPRLFDFLRPGGVLAVQMPNNWNAPTHKIPEAVLAEPRWSDEQRHLMISDRLDEPADYRRYLIDDAETFDMWQTTYFQEMTGPDPVWEWTTGSVLRPVIQALEPEELADFESAVKAEYRRAYPPDHTGTVLLPFSRFFLVAKRN